MKYTHQNLFILIPNELSIMMHLPHK